jgi:hypothetical protein
MFNVVDRDKVYLVKLSGVMISLSCYKETMVDVELVDEVSPNISVYAMNSWDKRYKPIYGRVNNNIINIIKSKVGGGNDSARDSR